MKKYLLLVLFALLLACNLGAQEKDIPAQGERIDLNAPAAAPQEPAQVKAAPAPEAAPVQRRSRYKTEGWRHRLGFSVGTVEGTYKDDDGLSVDMSGLYMEAPRYVLVMPNDLIVGAGYYIMATSGLYQQRISGYLVQLDLVQSAEVLAVNLGYSFPLTESGRLALEPQFVYGLSGTTKVTGTVSVDYTKGDAVSYEGTTTLSGLRVPVLYQLGKSLHLGGELALLSFKSTIEFDDGSQATIDNASTLAFFLGWTF